MRFKVITCESLSREMYFAASLSEHIIDFKFFNRDYHDIPEKMNKALQTEIDFTSFKMWDRINSCDVIKCPSCSNEKYDYIIIGIGLCGNAISNIHARTIPLIVPKAHDCNTFLLGSKEKFKEFINEEPGTIFYHFGQVERTGAKKVDSIPKTTGLGKSIEEYIKKYGKENAEYIKEMEYNWVRFHKRAAYLFPQKISSNLKRKKLEEVCEYVKQFNWNVVELFENKMFFIKLLNGKWNKKDFLVVPVGKKIVATNDDDIIKCM